MQAVEIDRSRRLVPSAPPAHASGSTSTDTAISRRAPAAAAYPLGRRRQSAVRASRAARGYVAGVPIRPSNL